MSGNPTPLRARDGQLSVDVSVVSPQVVLVNWTLNVDNPGPGHEVQLEIVYSPVQARYHQISI